MDTAKSAQTYYRDPVAQEENAFSLRKPPIDFDLPFLGTVKPRSAADGLDPRWMLGCETLDRDYADYDAYKEYLAPLGIGTLRFQGGWAKTETSPGVYDWAWLDHIVDDALRRGLKPWLQTGYGNPLYPGAGGVNLGAGMPLSPIGRTAYENWVSAMVAHYNTRVQDWEIWNEPNFADNKANTPEIAADFNLRTAQIIKAIQPSARISALALGHIDLAYVERFFRRLQENDGCALFDNVTYHDYVYNPDGNKLAVYRMRQIVEQYAPGLALRQGENGAPSSPNAGGALGSYAWSELSQAKWDTRRMLENRGNDIQCSVFGIAEMHYDKTGPITRTNTKGLLKTDSELRVIRPKIAYYAVQNVAAVMDERLERLQNVLYNRSLAQGDTDNYWYNSDLSIAVYGYADKAEGRRLYTLWLQDAIPTDSVMPQAFDFAFEGSRFTAPVLLDILTGNVYDIPPAQWQKEGRIDRFLGLPIYDGPVILAERSLLKLREA